MAQATLVPLEEYLRTSYSPDCEYVDGVVLERNVGDWLHSLVQSNLILVLRTKYPALKVVPELRAKVAEGRYRLPDVAVLLTAPTSTVLEQPPFIAIEILSADDSMTRVTEKLAEYAAMGAPNIWLFDPRLRRMYTFHSNALHEEEGDIVATSDPRLELSRAEIFQE